MLLKILSYPLLILLLNKDSSMLLTLGANKLNVPERAPAAGQDEHLLQKLIKFLSLLMAALADLLTLITVFGNVIGIKLLVPAMLKETTLSTSLLALEA